MRSMRSSPGMARVGNRMRVLADFLKSAVAGAALTLSSCAALNQPSPAPIPVVSKGEPIAFDDAHGPVPPQKSGRIIRALERESGDNGILQRHLAVEQALNQGSPLVLGNRLTLLQDGPRTYQAMFAAIRAATNNINLETYIFESGEIGNEFADLLLAKQATGVQVNLIYDSVGSLNTPREFFDRLRARGVRVVEFNPVNPAKVRDKKWLLNNRDHRKLLVVDGRIAFLGGINISEAYSTGSASKSVKKQGAPPEPGWRDTQLQVEGPVVAELQRDFMDTWARQKGPPLAEANYFPPLSSMGSEIVRAIASGANASPSPIYLTLLSAIDHAERFVHLTNAYFAPDPKLIESLVAAAQRGVDVELVLPGKTDSWLLYHAGRSHYAELLDAGVRIYERRDAVLHSKTASIDGVWATVGSTNLDWRSYLHNDELNAVVLGPEFSRQMEAMFARDRAASKPIDAAQWRRRSPLQRTEEWLARRLEYWL